MTQGYSKSLAIPKLNLKCTTICDRSYQNINRCVGVADHARRYAAAIARVRAGCCDSLGSGATPRRHLGDSCGDWYSEHRHCHIHVAVLFEAARC